MDQSIVRPYAQALFESAKSEDAVDRWDYVLSVLAETAQEPSATEVIASPMVSAGQVKDLFLQCCGDIVGNEGERLLAVLEDHNRFAMLPDLLAMFRAMTAELRGVRSASIISAVELDELQKQSISAQLEKRFNSALTFTWEIDPEIIGGLLITVDDTIIDASVRGRLAQMASALKM